MYSAFRGFKKPPVPEYLTRAGLWMLYNYNGRMGTVSLLDTEQLSSIPRTNMAGGENWFLKDTHTHAIASTCILPPHPLYVKTSAFYHRFILNSGCTFQEWDREGQPQPHYSKTFLGRRHQVIGVSRVQWHPHMALVCLILPGLSIHALWDNFLNCRVWLHTELHNCQWEGVKKNVAIGNCGT